MATRPPGPTAAAAAAEFVALWRSGACDDRAHAQLRALLGRCPLAGRVTHGKHSDPGFGRLLSADEWKRLSWVFGPEALPGFLGKSARDICLQLGFGERWLDAKLAAGLLFKLAVFPSESADARPATWDNIEFLLQTSYPEVWESKIRPHFPRICSTPFAELQAEAGYSMLEVNLVGRYDHATGESRDARYVSLQRLLRREGTLTEVRQFLFDEIGLNGLFSGSGRTVDDAGVQGPSGPLPSVPMQTRVWLTAPRCDIGGGDVPAFIRECCMLWLPPLTPPVSLGATSIAVVQERVLF